MNSPKRASNLAVPVRPSNLKQAAVFDDLRAIYLHIGRAASSSIKHILGTQSNTPKETVIKWCWGEMPLIDVTDERFKDYLFFTFIRNPW
ncbi:MAG: hypothetical protein KDD55_03565, partial [Bdellovibrionales bacterium]|nr:hypothetical protein [Bdellovibrionales bacterium]